jgi:predicted transcriptional regulator
MATLIEMTTDIVVAHASTTSIPKEELLATINDVYRSLVNLEKGEPVTVAPPAEEEKVPAISVKKAFGKDKVICMICGKGMKTLARHLKTTHGLKPGEYRKQFGIPRTQSLAAKAYSESRRQMAIDRGLGVNLVAARAAKAGKTAKPKAKAGAQPKARVKKTGE